jgi:hypothetical protein
LAALVDITQNFFFVICLPMALVFAVVADFTKASYFGLSATWAVALVCAFCCNLL